MADRTNRASLRSAADQAERINRQAAKVARLMRCWQWKRLWLECVRLRLMQRGLR